MHRSSSSDGRFFGRAVRVATSHRQIFLFGSSLHTGVFPRTLKFS